jgi:hypothetical protein
MRFVKQNTAFTHIMGPFVASTDGYTPVSGITPVTTDWRISKNGATLLTKSSATTTVYLESGYYQVGFASSDVDTIGHMKCMITLTSAGGALPVWDEFWVSESSEASFALSTAATSSIWNKVSESTESYGGQIRVIHAATAGISTGGGTATVKFYDPTGGTVRIQATVTTDGNRTAVSVTT